MRGLRARSPSTTTEVRISWHERTALWYDRGIDGEPRSSTRAGGGTRIVLACGGTAGHVHPALAVADAWRRLDPTAVLTFVGARGGLEERLAAAEGYECIGIRSAPFFGVGCGAKLRAVAR